MAIRNIIAALLICGVALGCASDGGGMSKTKKGALHPSHAARKVVNRVVDVFRLVQLRAVYSVAPRQRLIIRRDSSYLQAE